MNSKSKAINSVALKNSRELATALKQLPQEERLRVEGIIIGLGMRYDNRTLSRSSTVDSA